MLYFTNDVTAQWRASLTARYTIFGKTSTSKNKMSVTLNGKKETLNYWIVQCSGVKKYTECDHVLPNVCSYNVNWTKRVAERVNSCTKDKTAVDAFC